MSNRAFLLEVRFLDHRYHGVGDWPPSPFRVFQALVAGSYGGRWQTESPSAKDGAFRWLEQLEAPWIAAPRAVTGRGYTFYVPNNDADAIGGEPNRVAEIRAGKNVQPLLLPDEAVVRYAWPFEGADDSARDLCVFAGRLHTLGRGIDGAFASGFVLERDEALLRLGADGPVFRPDADAGDPATDPRVPTRGSLESLQRRHRAMAQRFELRRLGRTVSTLFRQPPRARCRAVTYDTGPKRLLFDLRSGDGSGAFAPIVATRAHDIAMAVRDLAAARLSVGDGPEPMVDRFVVGRGAAPEDTARRIRIIPIPSIGHEQTNSSVRRVLVEIPSACPVPAVDVGWAVSGQALSSFDTVDTSSGEAREVVLVPAEDRQMLNHYGVGGSWRSWRSVTPVALPSAGLPPSRSGAERVALEAELSRRVADAVRHAGLPARVVGIHLQTEPTAGRGDRAAEFSAGRFGPGVLHHVALTFDQPIAGPIVIGDGRFLGLGVLAPVQHTPGVHIFNVIAGLSREAEATDVARALRRAVMARAQGVWSRTLPLFFTGHGENGTPSREPHAHLTHAFEPHSRRLLVLAPHVVEHRSPTSEERRWLHVLETAVRSLSDLRAGVAGRLVLRPVTLDESRDNLFSASREWESATDYVATRHVKRGGAAGALAADVAAECQRRGLPNPEVTVKSSAGVAGVGLTGRMVLRFAVAVHGPLSLGRTRHFGGGLFVNRSASVG